MYNFSVDYESVDTGGVLDIHEYVMKKRNIK